MRSVRGFTLIEISIVIAIMLTMLTVELVADEFERLPGNGNCFGEGTRLRLRVAL